MRDIIGVFLIIMLMIGVITVVKDKRTSDKQLKIKIERLEKENKELKGRATFFLEEKINNSL